MYTREQLVVIFEEVGAKIPLWLFRSKKDVADAVLKLPTSTYLTLREHLLQVSTVRLSRSAILKLFQPPKRRNVMLEHRICCCSLNDILLVLKAEGFNIEESTRHDKQSLLDMIDVQPPAVVNNILLRLQPQRQPVIDRPFLTILDEKE